MRRANTAQICFSAGILLAAPGCSDSGDSRTMAVQDELAFIDAMIAHHEAGIAMADIAFESSESLQVKQTARSVKFIQQDEIAWLVIARERLTRSDRPDMETPATGADMTALQTASGAELDRLFLTQMIAHHAEAVEMAGDALPKLTVVHAIAVAMKILREEPLEIGMMQDTLADL